MVKLNLSQHFSYLGKFNINQPKQSPMKAKGILVLIFAITGIMVFGQRPDIEFTFTAVNNTAHVQVDSIKVMNRTQGGDTVLYWSDTVLSIYNFGIPEIFNGENSFRVFQNYPNPVADQTIISLYLPEKDKVSLIVTDMLGRVILKSYRVFDKGTNSFRFIPGGGNLYFFTAFWRGNSRSIKILQTGFSSSGTSAIEYMGSDVLIPKLKVKEDIQYFVYDPGDELLYIGYANGLQSGMLDAPVESETYTFQFATNIPCPGTPIVEYEGQVYNSIQIFSQCWLKENLDVGTRIPGGNLMEDNGVVEKHCYYDLPDSCAKYGGLYQWDEMMQYTTQQGYQGICPPGWHVPKDEEWKVLEGSVDSQYGIGDQTWDTEGYRGFDAGTNLKANSAWYPGGIGLDLFGFSGLPGGARYAGGHQGYFDNIVYNGYWWTSTEYDLNYAWFRALEFSIPEVNRYYGSGSKDLGFSVRCLRDE
jgi:uncharacterized protein (TIGR02145 family)